MSEDLFELKKDFKKLTDNYVLKIIIYVYEYFINPLINEL